MEVVNQIHKNFDSLDVVVNKHIQDDTFYKQGNQIVCSSNTAYAFCFMGGVDAHSIDVAGRIAMQVVIDAINAFNPTTNT